jgi:glycosyltransferase involved in cell wall biosynthesis
VTVHDVIPLVEKEEDGGQDRKSDVISRLALRQWVSGLQRAKRIIAVSEWTKRDLVERAGVPAERISVVHHGIDTDLFGPVGDGDALGVAECGLPPGTRYVLYVGSLHPRKRVTTLVRALAVARGVCPDLQLVLAGAPRIGSESATSLEIWNVVGRLGLSEAVHATSHVSDDTLARLYRRAVVTVLPSAYEGFGFPVVEAMACGCPVIAADATCLPEIVGAAGMLFRLDDVGELASLLIRITEDEELAGLLRGAGLQRSKAFSSDLAVEKTLAAYEDVSR